MKHKKGVVKMKQKLVSKCCKAEMKVSDGKCTHYYICTKCNKACDFMEDKNE